MDFAHYQSPKLLASSPPITQVSIFGALSISGQIHRENPQGGVLGISSDGDDRRIFGGLKFSILAFFWVRKFGFIRYVLTRVGLV